MKFTLPSLVNAYLLHLTKVSTAFRFREGGEKEFNQSGPSAHFKHFIDLELPFNDEKEVVKFLVRGYDVILEMVSLLNTPYPEIAIKLNLNAIYSVNDVKLDREVFESIADGYASKTMEIFQQEISESETRLNCMYLIIGTLCSVNILGKENLVKISSSLITYATKMVKRSDQCNAILCCCNLYWSNEILKDSKKVLEYLNKAKKFAEFAMTNPQNLILLVHILNKYIYFIEKNSGIVTSSMINDLMETYQNHSDTIKNENTNVSYLADIEKNYANTIAIIKARKEIGKEQMFTEVEI